MTYLYETIEPTRLYIKQCSHCGLKYFGKTKSKNIEKYKGSGSKWDKHLKKHNAKSIHLWNSDWYYDMSITRFALKFSRINKIVKSNKWANLKEEDGLDGGWSHVHTPEIQAKARENADKTMIERYGVSHPSMLPHVRETLKNKVPWNKGKTGIYKHRQEARDKISLAASNRIQPEKTKNKIRDSIIQHNKNKGTEFVFINGEYAEEIICLKMWCADNELDYQKVFSYLDKGPVKMVPRYDSPTRRWFLGKEIRRK